MYPNNFRYELYAELMGDTRPEEYTAEDVVQDMANAKKIDHSDAAAVIYAMLEVGPYQIPGKYSGEYEEDETKELKRLYDFMELCGYKLSDAENQILDGTHEYYYTED